jgi:hypothetical protein
MQQYWDLCPLFSAHPIPILRRPLSSEDDDTNGDPKARKPHVGLQFWPQDKTGGKQSNHKTERTRMI